MRATTDSIHVLHVDDEPDFADLAAEFLERQDDRIAVQPATSAQKGIHHLAESKIDCIVSDYDMPGMDGIEFLETVREDHPDLPFILYTGKGSEEVASDAFAAGATDYLQKRSVTEQYELLANQIRNGVQQYRAEQRAAKLERIRTLRSDINKALIRTNSRSEAETRVCEIISDSDPYLFAWIGEMDSETDRLEPRASAGVEKGYLDNITVTDDDSATGEGPGGTAIRERRVAVSQNIHDDPEFEPWRQDALERGYQSLAAVPLEYEGASYGVLGVYSANPHAFDDDETELVAELGADIGHAIHSFEMQQNLREERQLGEQALNAIDDLFYFISTEGDLERINDRATEIAGYSKTEILSMEVTDFFSESDKKRVEADIREALETGSSNLEVDIVTKDGDRIPHEFRNRRLTDLDGNIIGVVGIGRDISARNRHEREVKQQNERLDKFASIVSHDLRNPLNVAQGRIDLAQEECDTEHLDDARSAVVRSLDLIADMLELARSGEQISDMESVDIANVIHSCWGTVQTRDATMLGDSDATIQADRGRLRQLLENLFRNAIDHGGDDVNVSVGELDDGFYVEDDGPGIPETDREDVFEAGHSTIEGGTGLGLSIVEEIVKAHDWDIRITEGTEGGARFEIADIESVAE